MSVEQVNVPGKLAHVNSFLRIECGKEVKESRKATALTRGESNIEQLYRANFIGQTVLRTNAYESSIPDRTSLVWRILFVQRNQSLTACQGYGRVCRVEGSSLR